MNNSLMNNYIMHLNEMNETTNKLNHIKENNNPFYFVYQGVSNNYDYRIIEEIIDTNKKNYKVIRLLNLSKYFSEEERKAIHSRLVWVYPGLRPIEDYDFTENAKDNIMKKFTSNQKSYHLILERLMLFYDKEKVDYKNRINKLKELAEW